ncbi:MAG: CCA tRNA nucleotidyltransferase [Bacteroidia bacterium]|nr:CCA tRNA nucleotidyltransferase [Bacteroidia bacterium]
MLESNPLFSIIGSCADALGGHAFLVGGYVRDHIMKIPCKDIDIVYLGKGIELAEKVKEKLGEDASLSVFKNFGTAHLIWKDYTVEFVGARKESYRMNSRKPIVEDGTLEDDQLRRDFTINAMAVGLNGKYKFQFLDPFDGLSDMENKIIRTPLNPEQTFSDDPLRMIRAVRFASRLGYALHPDISGAIPKLLGRLEILSMERIHEELNKIILQKKPSQGFILLDQTGILRVIFPELVALKGTEVINGFSHKDNFYHTLEVLDNVASMDGGNLWLRWAALLHDIAKPLTRKFEEGKGFTFHGHEELGARMVPKIFQRLKLPLNEKMKYVQKLVRLHLRPIALVNEEVTDSAVRRVMFEAGKDLEDLMLLCEADITTKNPKKIQRYLSNLKLVREKMKMIEEKDKIRNWQPPLKGEEIMQLLNLKPSKAVGIIKDALTDAILDGHIPNEKEPSIAFVLEYYRNHRHELEKAALGK